MKKLVLFLLIVSCQTSMTPEDYKVRDQELAYFQRCELGEGTLKVKVADTQLGGGQFDLDWVSRSDGALQLEAIDSFGISFLSIAGRDKEFYWGGRAGSKMPSLELDFRGYLVVKGHWVGLKFAELGCLFKLQLPADWKDNLYVISRTPQRSVLGASSDGRRIKVTFNYAGEAITEICTIVSWFQWVVWKRKINMCFALQSPVKGSLDFGSATKVDWEL